MLGDETCLRLLMCVFSVANLGLLSNFLWSNAGFSSLRKLKLEEYDPRYNPTVVPLDDGIHANQERNHASSPQYTKSPPHPNRHASISDYHSLFEAGELTPLAVAETLLHLADSPKHKVAFLSVKKDQVLLAAKASTKRYKEGRALGPLDGVPLAVKGMLLLFSMEFACGLFVGNAALNCS